MLSSYRQCIQALRSARWDYRQHRLFRKWLQAQNSAGSSIGASLDFTGVADPYDCIRLEAPCCIERDVTIWFSPDTGAHLLLDMKRNVFIGRNTYLGIYQPISIGKNTIVGAYSYIISANHCYYSRDIPIQDQGFVGATIVIEDNVWIGTHVVVLPGVTIGTGAVVAAGAIVNNNIGAYEIWGGVPAKFIKMRPE